MYYLVMTCKWGLKEEERKHLSKGAELSQTYQNSAEV